MYTSEVAAVETENRSAISSYPEVARKGLVFCGEGAVRDATRSILRTCNGSNPDTLFHYAKS